MTHSTVPTVRLTLEQAQQLQWMTQHLVIMPGHPKFNQWLAEVKRPDQHKVQSVHDGDCHYVFRPNAQLPELIGGTQLEEYFYDGEHQARCREIGDVPVDGLSDDHYQAWENGEDLVFNGKVDI